MLLKLTLLGTAVLVLVTGLPQPSRKRQATNLAECRKSTMGGAYTGTMSTSVSGRTCLNWDSQSARNQLRYTLDADMFPDHTLADAQNYCRNPYLEKTGLFCATSAGQEDCAETELCSEGLPECKLTERGTEYRGSLSTTSSGNTCNKWIDADHNYCRNIVGSEAAPYCWVGSSKELCDVPLCEEKLEDCKDTTQGTEYTGTISVTGFGYTCQRWDADYPHANTAYDDPSYFADNRMDHNFCRNPSGGGLGSRPWCYTEYSGRRWDYCEIPPCSEEPPIVLAKHAVLIGVDGLDPCFIDAPGGATNIMTRLGDKGISTISGGRTTRSESMPAWATNLCGSSHLSMGVLKNGWMPPWKFSTSPTVFSTPRTELSSIPFPCVFRVLKQSDPSIVTGAIYDWRDLGSIMTYGDPGSVDHDEYIFAEWSTYDIGDRYVAGNASEYLADVLLAAERSFTFVYFGNLDVTGHSTGWCETNYDNYMVTIDNQVGQLLDAIDNSGKADETMVALVTDHGGMNRVHKPGPGLCTVTNNPYPGDSQCSDVPIFMRGPGIAEDQQFPSGTTIENKDVIPTIVKAMGVKRHSWWDGQPMTWPFE